MNSYIMPGIEQISGIEHISGIGHIRFQNLLELIGVKFCAGPQSFSNLQTWTGQVKIYQYLRNDLYFKNRFFMFRCDR